MICRRSIKVSDIFVRRQSLRASEIPFTVEAFAARIPCRCGLCVGGIPDFPGGEGETGLSLRGPANPESVARCRTNYMNDPLWCNVLLSTLFPETCCRNMTSNIVAEHEVESTRQAGFVARSGFAGVNV